MSKYDFDQALLGSIAGTSLGMQDDFLNKFVGTPRPIGFVDLSSDPAELLQITYQKLLEQVRDAIDAELEELE